MKEGLVQFAILLVFFGILELALISHISDRFHAHVHNMSKGHRQDLVLGRQQHVHPATGEYMLEQYNEPFYKPVPETPAEEVDLNQFSLPHNTIWNKQLEY